MLSCIQYAFLGHLRVNVRVTLSTHTYIVLYKVHFVKYVTKLLFLLAAVCLFVCSLFPFAKLVLFRFL